MAVLPDLAKVTNAFVADTAVVAYRAGLITRSQAIARIHACLMVTRYGAADLLDHPTLPSERYRRAYAQLRQLSRGN